MLFKHEGAPEGAVIFARAALQHLPTGYGANTTNTTTSASQIPFTDGVCLSVHAQVVMMLFEREGAPEGAVIFARAAL